MRQGEELVEEPFRRLIAERKLLAYPYDGFWAPMDTLKEKAKLDAMLRQRPRAVDAPDATTGIETDVGVRRGHGLMLPLRLDTGSIAGPLNVLAIGAHADDIEIGCGGTLLRLAESDPGRAPLRGSS